MHFHPVHRDLLGRFDANTHLVASHVEDGDDKVVVDDDLLVELPAEYEHGFLPWV